MNWALAAIFFLAVFVAFLTPMELGGFWGHLASGDWVLKNMALPHEDPFTVTVRSGPDIRFVLGAFWLCQAAYAAIYKITGLWGIIVLKAATFALIFHTLIRLGRGALTAYVVALPAVYIATFYAESRPQTFSFLFFAMVIYALERGREAYKKFKPAPRSLYLLPVLMVLWSNVHPGFVIALPLVGAYLLEAGAIAARGKPRPPVAAFVIALVLSAGLSGLNPNGFEAVARTVHALEASFFSRPVIHEHLPLGEFAEMTGSKGLYPAVVSLMVIGFLGFAFRWRKPDVLHLALFSALAFLSLKTFRVGFFFAIFAVAASGKNLACLDVPEILRGKVAKVLVAGALIAVTAVFLVPRTIIKKPLLAEGLFPEQAAEFVEREALPPNIYHPFEWGGYLLWRLYPSGYRVFIDQRGTGSYEEHSLVLNARPGWEEVLDKYGVNTVLSRPVMPYRADIPPIVLALQKNDGWIPVYWDSKSLIFVKSAFAKKTIRKDAVWEVVTSFLLMRISENPDDPAGYVSLGEVYAARGLSSLAAQSFGKALSLDPGNTRAIKGVEALKR